MKDLLAQIEEFLKDSVAYLPLETSSFLGGLIEEIIAPIPSPFVMAAVGSAAFSQSKTLFSLLSLSVFGSLGKTLGAWVIYVIADKLEDVIVRKFGSFLGVSHQEVEGLGKRFTGGWKDGLVLLGLRAVPVVPSSPVSVLCGIIKVSLPVYLAATFLGNAVRNFIYVYLGYAGISAYQSFLGGLDNMESVVQAFIFLGLAVFVGWIYCQRRSKERY